MEITIQKLAAPELSEDVYPVALSDATMTARKAALLAKMKENAIATAVIYADREHGANFEYFTGFSPRFEEALLVLHQDGKAFLLLGNENTKMVQYARIKAELIHVPFFSLPNQPMADDNYFTAYLEQAGIKEEQQTAVIGWKNFTSAFEENHRLFDVPHFIIAGLQKIIQDPQRLVNGTQLLIGPEAGIRTVNNANEIAHYEFGATLAGRGILSTLNQLALGKTELELAGSLAQFGQPINVTTICATGQRFTKANFYPRNKPVALGETFSATVGYKGGLSSRAAYVAKSRDDLPVEVSDYDEKVARPYFKAVVTWLETICIGLEAGVLYRKMADVLPQASYHWELNPGHYVADEEWLASPFYENSQIKLQSGQLFQIDIIPKVAGYGGAGCEDGIAIADEQLRQELQAEYPAVWARIIRRREYLKQTLNIALSEEILPLNDIVAYYRPYLLDQASVFCVK